MPFGIPDPTSPLRPRSTHPASSPERVITTVQSRQSVQALYMSHLISSGSLTMLVNDHTPQGLPPLGSGGFYTIFPRTFVKTYFQDPTRSSEIESVVGEA